MQAIARMQHRAMTRPKGRFVHPQSTANKRVYASRQYVKRAIKGLSETKGFDVSVSNGLVAQDSPVLQILSLMVNDDDNETREGDMVDPVSLEIKYYIKPVDATFAGIVRVIVFQWQADASDNAPTVADILHNNSLLNAVNSPHRFDGTRKFFRILYDRRHTLTTTNAGHITNDMGFVRITAKRLARIYFNGNDAKKGQLYVLATSNQLLADDEPQINLVSLLKYKDI